MKKLLSIAVISVLFLVVCLPVFADGVQSYSWYCIRNKEHKQPPLDSQLSFVNDFGGYYADKKLKENSTDKKVYLTFDVGYENGNVGKILDVLDQQQVKGAFFVLGNVIVSNPDLILRMERAGHIVCNHTYSHKGISKYSKDELLSELAKLEEAYTACTGNTMAKYFRPPEGRFSKKNMEDLHALGYKTIFWSFAYADWDNNRQMSPEKAKEKILSNIHNGAVLLLHPTSTTNAQILGDVICELKKQGYEFGTLDDLTS